MKEEHIPESLAFWNDLLSIPPANSLEKLLGKNNDFYSILINDPWRIIFKWADGNASQAETKSLFPQFSAQKWLVMELFRLVGGE